MHRVALQRPASARAARGASNAVTNVAMPTTGAVLGSSNSVTGSPEFQQRINADLEILRSSPAGRQMLMQLDASGNTVNIAELPNVRNGGATPAGGGNFLQTVTAPNGTTSVVAGTGANSSIAFNPSNHDDRFPNSVTVLYHELSHAYNHMAGTRQQGTNSTPGIDNGTNNREMQAVGLNNTGLSFNFPAAPAPPPPIPPLSRKMDRVLKWACRCGLATTFQSPAAGTAAWAPILRYRRIPATRRSIA
jgi:Effector protein